MPIRARERSDAICKLRYLSNYQILQYSNTMQFSNNGYGYTISRYGIKDVQYNTRDCWWVPFQVQVQVQASSFRDIAEGWGSEIGEEASARRLASWWAAGSALEGRWSAQRLAPRRLVPCDCPVRRGRNRLATFPVCPSKSVGFCYLSCPQPSPVEVVLEHSWRSAVHAEGHVV